VGCGNKIHYIGFTGDGKRRPKKISTAADVVRGLEFKQFCL
jgi:hypothetical protein